MSFFQRSRKILAGWLAFLCALLLTACGNTDQEELDRCEQALRELQAADNCRIIVYSDTDGELSQGSPRNRYWKHGDNWLQIKETGDSVFTYLHRDGIFYDNIGTAGVENGHILWNVGADRGNRKPWLLDYQCDPAKAELLETRKDEEGTHILLNIKEPITVADASADSYTAEFTFHEDGSFSNVCREAELVAPNGTIRPFEEISFQSTQNEQSIAREMEVAFRSKAEPLVSMIDGRQVIYGGLSLTLPEGYFCREGNGTGLLLLKNGVVAGGITSWKAPEEGEDWINSLGLWDVMADVSFMTMHFDGMVSASFVDEFDQASMNHSRRFYIRDTIVYDCWVDENLISQEEASALWETIVISSELPEIVELPPVDVSLLPQSFTCEDLEEGGFVIRDGEKIIGHIDIYSIPGGTMTTYDPYFRWLESLGIPDYADDTLCYMGGGSLYGDWEMHFESDLPPGQVGTVNHYHTFFAGKTQVWDIWFDLMVTDRGTMDTILTALTEEQ